MNAGALRLPGTLASVELVGEFVRGAARRAGLTAKAERRLLLAADELVTNIITHGSGGSHHETEIEVESRMDEQSLTIFISDDGKSFDPRALPVPTSLQSPLETRTPGGLGIYLLLKQLDDFDYVRRDDKNISALKIKRHDSHSNA
jgi:serine/threonine-protein kinase RsbW